jgi:sodium transport system permease protein
MRPNIFTIYLKEFREVTRDRRTLIFMLVFPTVIMPLIFHLMTSFMMKADKKARTESITYAVDGAENLPELVALFNEKAGFKQVEVGPESAFKQAIGEHTIKLGLAIPEGAAEKMANKEQVTIRLHYNNASLTSRVDRRAADVITSFSEDQRAAILKQAGFTSTIQRDQVLEPVLVQRNGTAEMREILGERMGGLLPYFFVIFCFLGSLYPAIDLGAGEKERGTLETLLLTPVPRHQIVLGKFLVVFTTGVIASVLSLVGMGVWLATKGKNLGGDIGPVVSSINPIDLVLLALMLIPVAAIFASLLLSISIYAKSFKEAQTYATPVNFLIIIPAMIAMMPGVELNWTWAMVPITNIALATKEVLKGTMDYTMLVAIMGSTTIIAGAMLVFCTKWFERESVLFRE